MYIHFVLIVCGVNAEGQREPLDLMLADSETQMGWEALFSRLKSRGLRDVDLVVSDNHAGLVVAVKKHFQGALWQRCQTHFMRNVLGGSVKTEHQNELSALSIKQIDHWIAQGLKFDRIAFVK